MRVFARWIFLLLITVSFSCSEDNNNPPPTDRSGQLEGRWSVASYIIEGNTTTIVVDEVTVREFEGLGADFNYFIFFGENPNSYQASGDYIFTLQTTSEGQTTVTGSNVVVNDQGSWTRNNNTVTITEGGETYNLVISKLTDSELRYSRNISEDQVNGNTSTSTAAVEEFILFRAN